MTLPRGPYTVVYADPPWSYQDKRLRPGPKGNAGGSAARHYPTMSLDELKALPVADIAADPSLLFLWATWPLMPRCIEVVEAWGFTYKTAAFNWIKTRRGGQLAMGVGSYTRSNSEPCLLGVRGRGASLVVDHSIVNVLLAERSRHSAKPAAVRDLIVRLVGNVPRIELFARERAPGWDAWGDEV